MTDKIIPSAHANVNSENKFEIVGYLASRVLDLRMSGDISEELNGLGDDDVFVRVIGRCIAGPAIGNKAAYFHVMTAELHSDPNGRAFVEHSAHLAWSKLKAPPWNAR